MVHGPRNQLFPGPTLARNQNGCIALRDSFGQLDELPHPRAGNDSRHA
jgi:hypothetical protein